ncbi:hypothetical protein, partial [Pseudomonas syringae]|uniref:hypothetical protein n=1 Tax=Pseudomonas syringae TaxID=317 RepID=UPI001E4628CB
KPVSTCRSELVREAAIADAENTSNVIAYSRTSSLLQKPVSTCRSELVREDAIADAEITSNVLLIREQVRSYKSL